MGRRIILMIGTQKGAFFYHADEDRADWTMTGPHLSGWDVYAFHGDTRNRRIWAGTSHYAYGPSFRVSDDLGKSWQQLDARPAFASETGWSVNRIWQITAHPTEADTLFAGVEEAGLFVTRDAGSSWREIESLTRRPNRAKWFPGNGGLCLHTILIDPTDPRRMWVGISAVGAFRTTDAGANWTNLNKGLPAVATGSNEQESMCCIHKMVLDPLDQDVMYMQYHGGVFRSDNAGDTWKPIESGLPGNFGFPMVITQTGELFIAPLLSDEQRFFLEGRAAIYRSRDRGETWQACTSGLPTEPYFAGVLRDAMAVDPLEPAGVYVGTTMGDLFYSRNAGDTWHALPGRLPRISTVRVMVLD